MDDLDWNEIDKEIYLFLKNLGAFDLSKEKNAIMHYLFKFTINSLEINNIMAEIQTPEINKKRHSLLLLIKLFFYIEGALTFWIDLMIYILVKFQHHDLYDPINRKFVDDFEEIAFVNLDAKIKFLELHGLFFISNLAQKEIRNAIAHQDYSINSDGTITIYKKLKEIKTISQNELKSYLQNIENLPIITAKNISKICGYPFDEINSLVQSWTLEDWKNYFNKYWNT